MVAIFSCMLSKWCLQWADLFINLAGTRQREQKQKYDNKERQITTPFECTEVPLNETYSLREAFKRSIKVSIFACNNM